MAIRRQRPPEHRADAPIVYVHPKDAAWDQERIDREVEELEADGKEATDHPLSRYFGGWTRYDLDAPLTLGDKVVTAREYLDESKAPTKYKLQRLGPQEFYEIKSMWEQEILGGALRPRKAYLRACVLGILSVENGPELQGVGKGKSLRASDVQKLHELAPEVVPELPIDIGEAVYNASMPLRDDEKKA